MKTKKEKRELSFSFVIYERFKIKTQGLIESGRSRACFHLQHFICEEILQPNSKFAAVILILLFGFYKNSAYTSQNSLVVESSTKKSKIVFLKTHKTGSSTIQNILYRYGIGNVEILSGHNIWSMVPEANFMRGYFSRRILAYTFSSYSPLMISREV